MPQRGSCAAQEEDAAEGQGLRLRSFLGQHAGHADLLVFQAHHTHSPRKERRSRDLPRGADVCAANAGPKGKTGKRAIA